VRLIVALMLFTLSQLAFGAEPVGRLFFTTDQRAQLNTLRAQRIVASQVKDEPIPELVKFSGLVRRNDGKSTVWVNGQSLSDAELRSKQSVTGTVGRNGDIFLKSPEGNTQTRLKVGQQVELLSGRVEESYATRQPVKSAATPAQKPAAPDTKAGSASPAKSDTPPARETASEPESKTAPR